MTTNPSAPKGVELAIKAKAAREPNSNEGRLHQDKIAAFASMIEAKHPNADSKKISELLVEYENRKPDDFRPFIVKRDLSGLTPSQLLALANREDSVEVLRWKREKK